MTRYILAGGGDKQHPNYWADLSRALAGAHRPVRVLSCLFARPREHWETVFEQWQPLFTQYLGADTLIELAMPAQFERQVREASVIYLHGGDDMLLETYLSRYKHLERLFEGKTVIGSSAGATFLCKYGWTCDWRAIWQGSGIVPVRVIVHYGSDFGAADPRGPIDWEAAKRALEPYEPNLPLHCLREGEFTIIDT